MLKHITSVSNQLFKEWRSLLGGRGIRKQGKALVSGEKIVRDILAKKPEIVLTCILAEKKMSPPVSLPPGIPVCLLKNDLFRELDVHGTGFPLLLAKIPESKTYTDDALKDGVLLLVPFQDPVNVGAVIRTAAAFCVWKIMMLKESASPFHPKSIRASGAQAFHVQYFQGPSIDKVDMLDVPVVALSSEGTGIGEFVFPKRFALLAGLEGPGLPPGLKADHLVSIPMEPGIESLNAAVAASIALFEWRNRQPR